MNIKAFSLCFLTLKKLIIVNQKVDACVRRINWELFAFINKKNIVNDNHILNWKIDR
jgi:hypothetical protein